MNKRRGMLLLIAFLYVAGASFLFYPAVSNMISRDRNERIISSYQESLEITDQSVLDGIMAEAEEYNRNHKRNYVIDAFIEDCDHAASELYEGLLDPFGNGVMGYIEIPKIKETLAVYHGTSEAVLEQGVGHIEGTSLPIGGSGTHSVLAGHRGLPSAKLFTDLDRLEIGDDFYLHVIGRTLRYTVDRIITVNPDDTEGLKIEEGQDHVTLLTCTPYGINTKRLLVRGKRAPYEECDESNITEKKVASMSAKALIISLIVGFTVTLRLASKRKCGRMKNV